MPNILIDPQVISDTVSEAVKTRMKFRNIAVVNHELEGKPGSTLDLPKFGYIGDAVEIAKGEAIPLSDLTSEMTQVTVKQAGKAGEIYDREELTGFGNPLDRLTSQIETSILNKLDADCFTALTDAVLTKDVSATSHLNSDAIADGLVLFGENAKGPKVLFIGAQQLADIRKDPDFIKVSEFKENESLSDDVEGKIWGCQLIVSDAVVTKTGKYENYIAKPDAIGVALKRDVDVETARDILKKSTVVAADMHYVAYLADESKVVKLVVADKPVA